MNPDPDDRGGPIVVHPENVGDLAGTCKILGPDGRVIELPKYDPESFPESDQIKVPAESNYLDHSDLVYKVAVDLHRGRVPMLWGPAGVGKTQLARHMAFLMRVPFERIPLGETSEREDVTGHYELKGSTTEWVQSRLARSITRPGVTCIDEWNAAPPAVLHVARPILDDSAQLALDAYDGRILLKHRHQFMLATGNPDWMPQYAGLMPLSEADGDRLSHINVGWPEPDAEAQIVLQHLANRGCDAVPAWHVVCAMKSWSDLRTSVDDGTLAVTAGTRSLMNFVELLEYQPVREAMKKVYERVDPQTYSKIEQVLDHHDWGRHPNLKANELHEVCRDPAAEVVNRVAELFAETESEDE